MTASRLAVRSCALTSCEARRNGSSAQLEERIAPSIQHQALKARDVWTPKDKIRPRRLS
jgi:hypothetical protein